MITFGVRTCTLDVLVIFFGVRTCTRDVLVISFGIIWHGQWIIWHYSGLCDLVAPEGPSQQALHVAKLREIASCDLAFGSLVRRPSVPRLILREPPQD